MPTLQNCSKCGGIFIGSDALGDPCDRCNTEINVIEITCPGCNGNNDNCLICGGDGQICGIIKTQKNKKDVGS